MKARRRGFGFPLFLIAVGCVALLANLGLLPFAWTGIFSLWPLVLVVIGIDLLLAHRAPLAALALDATVVVLGIALLAVSPSTPFPVPFVVIDRNCPSAPASDTITVAREGAQRLTLRLTGGAGTYRLGGGSSALVDARSDASDLSLTVRKSASTTDVRLTQCTSSGFGGGRTVDVHVANDLPTSLELTGGAGTFDLDLRDAMLTDARLTQGASSTHLLLPKPSGEVPVRITGGASSIIIDLPSGADARVETTGGLTSLNSPATTSSGVGRSTYETPGYAAARDRYTITVTGGVSTVTVR